MGPTRSTRLPLALDRWFAERLDLHPERSASELLVQLVHGGLRLREGYMAIHRRGLEDALRNEDRTAYTMYRAALHDTFGQQYVAHLERWLVADGIAIEEPEKTSTA